MYARFSSLRIAVFATYLPLSAKNKLLLDGENEEIPIIIIFSIEIETNFRLI